MLKATLGFLSAALLASASTEGCISPSEGVNGFNAIFFEYPLHSTKGREPDFFKSGYMAMPMGSATQITDVNFDFVLDDFMQESEKELYKKTVTVSNFALELSGFFVPTKSGLHTFAMDAKNGAALMFGKGESCCGGALGSVSDHISINTHDAYKDRSFLLEKGQFYPMKIVFYNPSGNSHLTLECTDPLGNKIENVGEHVYQGRLEYCIVSKTETWTKPYASIGTIVGSRTKTIVHYVPEPTAEPTEDPVEKPTEDPIEKPTAEPTEDPVEKPTKDPVEKPTAEPTEDPVEKPTAEPTEDPVEKPTEDPIEKPTAEPTEDPVEKPTAEPTEDPVEKPTEDPIEKPTAEPTEDPVEKPTKDPVEKPTAEPTEDPVEKPTEDPIEKPTAEPTEDPVEKPTKDPVEKPTAEPTEDPVEKPTAEPTEDPVEKPTAEPTEDPVEKPTEDPIEMPTADIYPTKKPTTEPRKDATAKPTAEPSKVPEFPVYSNSSSKTHLTKSFGSHSFTNSTISGPSTHCDDTCESSKSIESCTLSTQKDGKVVTVTICDSECKASRTAESVSTLTQIDGQIVTVTVCDAEHQAANPNGDYSVITKIDKSVVTVTVCNVECQASKVAMTASSSLKQAGSNQGSANVPNAIIEVQKACNGIECAESSKFSTMPALTSTTPVFKQDKTSSILPYEGSASTKSIFMILCSIPVFAMLV